MAKNPKHRELELKFEADTVDLEVFKKWCFGLEPEEYLHTGGPDVYYSQGPNVLRHRNNGEGAGELTVKRRTSRKTTTDREEIDLRFAAHVTVEDVEKFLQATGWKPMFTVIKDCHIFAFKETPGVEIVIYDVRCVYPNGEETPLRRFAEIEIHKADSNSPHALSTLKEWERSMHEEIPGLTRCSESLYEIYSGKRYGLVKK